MEPCLFRHGKEVRRNETHKNYTGLQWSHVFSDMVSSLTGGVRYLLRQLQWSHVFSDMVRVVAVLDRPDLLGASMEPCLFRHGKDDG